MESRTASLNSETAGRQTVKLGYVSMRESSCDSTVLALMYKSIRMEVEVFKFSKSLMTAPKL